MEEKDHWILVDRKNKHCLYNSSSSSSKIPPPTSHFSNAVIAKADSAASNHYFPLRDAFALNDLQEDTHGPTVILPDSSNLTATKKGHLPIRHLSTTATKTSVFKNLHSPLISLGQLCDDGCTVNLDREKITVSKNDKIILKGTRSRSGDGLWDVPLPTAKNKNHAPAPSVAHQSINVIIRHDKKAQDLATYLHGCLFSPTIPTLIQAIKSNFLLSFPGLTAKLIEKHLPPSVFTTAGHLRQEKQGLRSTKQTQPNPVLASENSTVDKTNDLICALVSTTDKAFMDLTGRFPYRSSRGNEYIFIAYHYDTNAILGLPIQNRQAKTITTAWQQIQQLLLDHGQQTNLWVLDNETSNELKSAMSKYKIDYQLVPPHNHRRNASERAIQTFKNHFKAGLASVDPDFPISEWDRLLHQAFLTLNLLRPSRLNPKLSAYAQLFGQFDFNATPLAPPGTKVMVHNKPSDRASWDPNAKLGWYIGPSPHHYRCMKCYIPSKRSEINTDTLVFFPKQINFPEITADDFIQQAASDIISLLTHPPSTTVPSLTVGDSTKNALLEIATILHRNPLSDSVLTDCTRRTTAAAAALPRLQPAVKPKPVAITPSSNVSPSATSLQSLHDAIAQLTRVIKSKQSQTHPHPAPSRKKFISNHPESYKSRAARFLQNQQMLPSTIPLLPTVNHIYDKNGKKQSLEQLLHGENKDVWIKSASNEFGRLTQGNIHGVTAQDALDFIPKSDVPSDRDVTYASFVCDYRPLKDDPYRVRLVVGGDKLTYADDAGSPAASLLETKLLINSVISTPGARFMSMDLKDHFLCTPMLNPEYMKIPFKYFPQDIIDKYNLNELEHNGFVYCKIKKGMYGLKQASVLAYNYLCTKLEPHGYRPIPHTVGLWKHDTRPLAFCLCVDDFGVKYERKEDVNHLLSALQETFKVSTDWDGKHFCGLTFGWNYAKRHVDVSMPKYIPDVLHKFQHPTPRRAQKSPYNIQPHQPFKKGQRQYAPAPDTSDLLDAKGKTRIQSIVGSLLYYARAIDHTLLPALNTISASQAAPTKATEKRCNALLDYVATYPNVFLRYHASDMILTVDSDAAYLVEPNARSRIAGYFQLNSAKKSNQYVNGALLIECKTLRHVVASSAEAETAGLFHNSQVALPIRYMLTQLSHPQPKTPMKTDNLMSNKFIHNNITQRRSKSWDMRYYWLRDKESQELFEFYWAPSEENLADYHTKHHTAKYHSEVRGTYVHDRTPMST